MKNMAETYAVGGIRSDEGTGVKFWLDTLKSRLWLTLVTYVLYMTLYLLTDEVMREFYLGGHSLLDYVLDVGTMLVCIFLFV